MCLDAEGFHDDENDGPVTNERLVGRDHADIIWMLDLKKRFGVKPFQNTCCSVTVVAGRLFVIVSQGAERNDEIEAKPAVPSFLCLDARDGKELWIDDIATPRILECQWSSPCVFECDGQAQVVMAGGDGWVYSFDPAGDGQGRSKLLWKFDTNPKTAKFAFGGRSTRSYSLGTPVFYDGRIYIGNGSNPEHGEGPGHLYCLDPTQRGDISIELAVDANGKPLAPRRDRAVIESNGERAIPNPNSGAIWHYAAVDRNGDGKIELEETFHRTLSSTSIANDLLFVTDLTGILHCLDAKKSVNGQPVVHWTHDLFAMCWTTPLIADGKVFVTDEDGKVSIFQLAAKKTLLAEHDHKAAIYTTPIAANNTLFIATQNQLLAIAASKPVASVNSSHPQPETRRPREGRRRDLAGDFR